MTKPESEHVQLAQKALELYVKKRQYLPVPQGSPLTREKAASFVSLKIDGSLRGCIGTLEPVCENLSEEIIQNSVAAGCSDPRFPVVSEQELPFITYSVDVLSEPEKIESITQLDPQRFGVIVQKGTRKGVLLPDLAGVDTVEEQLEIALQKAGISPEENFSIYRFTVKRYR